MERSSTNRAGSGGSAKGLPNKGAVRLDSAAQVPPEKSNRKLHLGNLLASSLSTPFGGGARKPNISPIAVDFGESSLKLLQIVPGEPPTLAAAACVPTPDELRDDIHARLEFQFGELSRLMRTGGFKGKRAVCAIPASQTFCKHLQLGRATESERETVIQRLLGEELGRDPHTLVYRSYDVRGAVGAGAARNEVVVMAACRGLVGKLMHGLRSAKLDAVGMHNEWSAVLRAFERMHRRDDDADKSTLYMDVGSAGARVSVAHGRNLVFARSLEVGGRLFDEGYASYYSLDKKVGRVERLRLVKPPAFVQARANEPVHAGAPEMIPAGSSAQQTQAWENDRRRDRAATGLSHAIEASAREVDPGLRDSYEILADEISMCVRYHEALFGPRRLNGAVFFGGEAKDGTLCHRVARMLRVPTQIADPFSCLVRGKDAKVTGFEPGEPQPAWVLPLGLCESPTEL
jgi:Tfp pilus assembly PilM family ATPase